MKSVIIVKFQVQLADGYADLFISAINIELITMFKMKYEKEKKHLFLISDSSTQKSIKLKIENIS